MAVELGSSACTLGPHCVGAAKVLGGGHVLHTEMHLLALCLVEAKARVQELWLRGRLSMLLSQDHMRPGGQLHLSFQLLQCLGMASSLLCWSIYWSIGEPVLSSKEV
jgi:hypothetical protein